MQQVSDDVFLGTGTDVNWVVLREGRDLTLVDAGYPGDHDRLVADLASIGHTPGDLAAVLLTHAHVDHVGGVNRLHDEHGVPLLTHPDEVPLARGERREQASRLDVALRVWRPRVAAWTWRICRAGGLQHVKATHARAWSGDEPLDLPGRPVPVPVVGHTSGSTAYLVEGAGVVATGDALVTGHDGWLGHGPQLVPDFFSEDPERARASLDALVGLPADTVLPGHGPVWRGDLAQAVATALRS